MSSSSDKKKFPLAFRVFRSAVPVFETLVPFVANRLAFMAFFYPYRYPIPKKEKALAAEASMSSFKYRGLDIKVYDWGGTGPTVLFMHGWSSRCTQLIAAIQAFRAEGYRCIGFDAPGHGLSEGGRTDVIQFAECLQECVKLVGPIDYAVAHSMGGTAVILATQYGLSARKYCFMSTPTVADDILEVYRDRMNASPKTKRKLKEEIWNRYNREFEHFTAAYLAKTTALPPTLLIYDKNDEDVPTYHGEVMRTAIPGSKLLNTENLGHTRILKDQGVAQTVLNFIKSAE